MVTLPPSQFADLNEYLDAGPLLDKLGGLPLALAQAGAYIRATGLTVEEYTAYYDETWDKLMAYQNLYPLQEYAERSVLTTWKMSYEHVRAFKRRGSGIAGPVGVPAPGRRIIRAN